MENRRNKVIISNDEGKIPTPFLPFGRGATEVLFDTIITGNPDVIDITGLDYKSNYMILLNNITPYSDNVKLMARVFDGIENNWKVFENWMCQYSNNTQGLMREFNADTDMMLCESVGSNMNGLSGYIYLTGFGPYTEEEKVIKSVRGDITNISATSKYTGIYQSAGMFDKNSNKLTGIRLYFNQGTFLNGQITLFKFNLEKA